MKPCLLITGGSGLLALNWAATVCDEWDVVLALHTRQVDVSFARTVQLDLFHNDAIQRVLDDIAPRMVVHAAGLTNVEACEADPDLARRANVEAPGHVAAACARHDAKLVTISTDHLFSGAGAFVSEQTAPAPLNVYARTKADGEKAALDNNPQAIVARTNFVCWGPRYRPSFSDTIIAKLQKGEPVFLFEDVFFNPILASELAHATHALASQSASGIFHLSGDERLSKLEFGLRVASHFHLDSSLIRASRLADRTDLTRRPSEMSLSNRKAAEILDRPLGGIEDTLRELAAQLNTPKFEEIRRL